MDILRKASHVLVAGMSGMGKTSYGERYLVGSHHDRVFLFDHQSEFQVRLNLLPCYSLAEMRERAQTERFVAFDFTQNFKGQLEESFDLFCEEVFRMCEENLEPAGIESIMVTDELQKIVPLESRVPRPLKNVYQTGRRYKLDTLTLTQAPNELHNNIRVQITEAAMFKLTDENSLKFISKMGWETESIMKLPDLHYNWYNRNTSEVRYNCKINYPKKS